MLTKPRRRTAFTPCDVVAWTRKSCAYVLSCPSLHPILSARPSSFHACDLIEISSGIENVSRRRCLVAPCIQLAHWQLSRSQILGIVLLISSIFPPFTVTGGFWREVLLEGTVVRT